MLTSTSKAESFFCFVNIWTQYVFVFFIWKTKQNKIPNKIKPNKNTKNKTINNKKERNKTKKNKEKKSKEKNILIQLGEVHVLYAL